MVVKPLFVINFKTYKAALGAKAVRLARICSIVSSTTGAKIWIAVSAPDIYRVATLVDIPVLSEHVDPVGPDRHTGAILARDVKDNGAFGTLLNHSEHPMSLEDITFALRECERYKLKAIVCASGLREAKAVASLKPVPFAIAYEDPELIGTGKSITKVKTHTVRLFVQEVKKVNKKVVPLCGAGITNSSDVKTALHLGCRGVLVSSAVTKAKRPKQALLKLIA